MFCFFFFNDTATTEIYTLSLHDALPISKVPARKSKHQSKNKSNPKKAAKKNNSREHLEGETRRLLIGDLCEVLETYLPDNEVSDIYRAYLFGAEAHAGQTRKSGEPYIHHPMEVAHILAGLHLDSYSLIAAILHDTIEDTETAKAHIASEFGEDVAELVDGVSKISQIEFQDKEEEQAENFRKMMLAMTRDIRVIIIKMADRLHNMRTISALPLQKRSAIARDTRDIFAPIANRLGVRQWATEFEDLSFSVLHPMRYRVLADAMGKRRGNRKAIVERINDAIVEQLKQEGVDGEVTGREKSVFSVYRKMREKVLSFEKVHDLYAFRIIVDRVDTCYRVLGIIHNLYKPIPGRFKDYIAIPKTNGYQSLHTIVFGPYSVSIEVQIRTRDMQIGRAHV